MVQDAFAALVQDLRRPWAAGRLSWAAIQEGRAALVEALAVRLLQQEQLCHGRGCAQVAAELAQATYERAAAEPGGGQQASRVLARALVAAVGAGRKAAVAELQLVLWRRRQLALLRDTLAGMAEGGEAGVRAAAEVAWLLVRTGEGATVGDVQAAMVLEGGWAGGGAGGQVQCMGPGGRRCHGVHAGRAREGRSGNMQAGPSFTSWHSRQASGTTDVSAKRPNRLWPACPFVQPHTAACVPA